MAKKHMVVLGAFITSLLSTACNPIPPKPSPAALSLSPEPMQANLHDFAFALAEIFDEEIEPEIYADIISKIDHCLRSRRAEDTEDLYTPGQTAAMQWISILVLTTHMASEMHEDIKPHSSSFYNRLIRLREFCMKHSKSPSTYQAKTQSRGRTRT